LPGLPPDGHVDGEATDRSSAWKEGDAGWAVAVPGLVPAVGHHMGDLVWIYALDDDVL